MCLAKCLLLGRGGHSCLGLPCIFLAMVDNEAPQGFVGWAAEGSPGRGGGGGGGDSQHKALQSLVETSPPSSIKFTTNNNDDRLTDRHMDCMIVCSMIVSRGAAGLLQVRDYFGILQGCTTFAYRGKYARINSTWNATDSNGLKLQWGRTTQRV